MPYVKVGRLRQLEACEREYRKVLAMSPREFSTYQADERMKAVMARWMQKTNEDMLMTHSPLLTQIQGLRKRVNA